MSKVTKKYKLYKYIYNNYWLHIKYIHIYLSISLFVFILYTVDNFCVGLVSKSKISLFNIPGFIVSNNFHDTM
jgi:hypothetical protein